MVGLQPNKLIEYQTGFISETVASVLAGGNPHETIISCATLEMYKKTPIFIPTDITEYAVKLVAQKPSENYGLRSTESEALQGWLLKFDVYIKRLRNSVETFI